MRQLKVLAVAAPENTNRINSLLECEFINRMATLAPDPGNLDRAASFPADAVVVLSDELTDAECGFVEKLYMSRGRLAFILISSAADAGTLSRAMQCGVTRVLSPDAGSEQICRSVEEETVRTLSRQESAEIRNYDSRVISIFSTKGGSGKTTVAVNLAAALRLSGKKAALVDLGLQFGDVGVFMNLPRCDTISDLVAEGNLNPSTVKSYLYRHSCGVDVLCAPVSPELAELIRPEHIERIITVLRAEYDYVLLDLEPTLDDNTLSALEHSDTIYFITAPEIPTLKNTRICISILKTLNYADKVRLILNREGGSFVSVRDVRDSLEMEPAFCIPNDGKHASAAVNRGVPVVLASPKSKISRSILSFVKKGGV